MSYTKTCMVSVTMLAYNHGRYIRQAVESVLTQKTNFYFQVIVGEDCSPAPDSSRKILKELKAKYGDQLILVFHEKNIGVSNNANSLRPLIQGKYWANCECDDYWTDDTKLQRQYDFLESNPEYSACATNSCVVDDDGKALRKNFFSEKNDKVYTLKDFKRYGNRGLHCNSLLMRTAIFPNESADYMKLRSSFSTMGDTITFSMLYVNGPIYIIKDVMHAHREGSTVNTSFSAQQYRNIAKYTYIQIEIVKAINLYYENKYDFTFVCVNRIATIIMYKLFFSKRYAIAWKDITVLIEQFPCQVRAKIWCNVFVRIYYRSLEKCRKLLAK